PRAVGRGRAGGARRGTRLAGTGVVRPDRPRGVLPGEGRLDAGGQAHLLGLRGPGRMPGVRPDARRALGYLGRPLGEGASAPAPRRRLTHRPATATERTRSSVRSTYPTPRWLTSEAAPPVAPP